jgi:outer membrane protein
LVFATLTSVTSALLFLPTALAAQASADSVAHPISLAEAVKLAQRNSPTTVQAAGTTRANAASVRSAVLSFIHGRQLQRGASKQSGDRIGRQGRRAYSRHAVPVHERPVDERRLVRRRQPAVPLRTAKANVNAAEANETLQQYNVPLSVKQQYYAVLAARESESAAQAQLDQATEQLKPRARRWRPAPPRSRIRCAPSSRSATRSSRSFRLATT